MKESNYNILIVDDEQEYSNVVSLILTDLGYRTATCCNGKEALDHLRKNTVDLVITDLRMPVMTGEELIGRIIEEEIDVDVIVATAFGSIESAVEAIRLGAADYFVKTDEMDELILKIERITRMRRLKTKSDIFLRNLNTEEAFLESRNPEFQQLLDVCERTANTNINILLKGESGVGKEVLANHIHRISDRASEPFIPVNCQVFPEGVIESELFGHEKGAFTGAVGSRTGKFEEANYGTLFLDEIGDLPLTTQGKLLRAIETRSIERVGSNKQIRLDLRFIFATNKNLVQGIEEGTFREDLFYRINTLTLTIPPLRDRKEDLPGLIEFFIRKTAIDQKKGYIRFDDEVLDQMMQYDYPGNVRELRNMIERMIALSRDGRVTMAEYMMPAGGAYGMIGSSGKLTGLRDARRDFEKKYITEALKRSDWNVNRCAELLGITSRQLWNKIGQYGIKKD